MACKISSSKICQGKDQNDPPFVHKEMLDLLRVNATIFSIFTRAEREENRTTIMKFSKNLAYRLLADLERRMSDLYLLLHGRLRSARQARLNRDSFQRSIDAALHQ